MNFVPTIYPVIPPHNFRDWPVFLAIHGGAFLSSMSFQELSMNDKTTGPDTPETMSDGSGTHQETQDQL